MQSSNSAHAARAAFGAHRRPSHLRQVVQRSYELGVAGVHAPEAMDARDEAIYADGKLPADTPSRLRAWRVTTQLADEARYQGARIAVRREADAAVAVFRDNLYRALYATAYHAARYVWSDSDIVDAVEAAFVAAGHEFQLGAASPMFPIRRACAAQAIGDGGELASFPRGRAGSDAERVAYLAELNDAAASRVAGEAL